MYDKSTESLQSCGGSVLFMLRAYVRFIHNTFKFTRVLESTDHKTIE